MKKEMIAMLLAGGQGSRLGVLTDHVAKPAVSFGAKYRIIDFPLSNCTNSGIDTVGVLTQYQPLILNTHIGIGIPWDLDVNDGGVTVLPPYESTGSSEWYSGTANAIYQNFNFIEHYDPEYILILSGDHIYKMDYQVMLDFHKEKNADITVACISVPYEEAHRFGIMITDDDSRITDFEEKPENPRSTLASMGIYIFNWKTLKEELTILKDQPSLDFGKHVLPDSREHGGRLYAYEFTGYWKDVGTLQSYWEANMGLVDIVPEFNLYEEFWPIYTNSGNINAQYISPDAKVIRSIVGEGAEINGHIHNSVIGVDVKVGKGSYIRDSIIMRHVTIGENCHIEKTIIADNTVIGNNVCLGAGEAVPNKVKPNIYSDGIVTIGENSVIPDNVEVGKNTAISGITGEEDYPDGKLASGELLLKEGK